MGMASFLAMAGRPATWSVCSWVMRMAVMDPGATSEGSRLKVSFELRPASMRTRVRPVETSAELPALELARTVRETIAGTPP